MKIKGEITTGMGKAKYFISNDYYSNQIIKKCGFKAYPGTLNIIIDEKLIDEISNIKNNTKNIINQKGNFGAVKYIKAILNEKIEGAIVFPDKTAHDENYLEFIADENLRKKFNLKDGDLVEIEILD